MQTKAEGHQGPAPHQPVAQAETQERQTSAPAAGLSAVLAGSPRAQAEARVVQAVNSSPLMSVQRQTINGLFANVGANPGASSGTPPVQLYSYGSPTNRNVTVTGKKGSKTFEECTYNKVEYKANDAKKDGTATSTPANWADWLTNNDNTNNATQLHVVNKRWGGLGGQDEKNIVPGSPKVNSHHLHEAEKKFDETCFGGSAGQKALQDTTYECTATPDYGTAIDVKNGPEVKKDPALKIKISTSKGSESIDVSSGGGVSFKDAS